MQYYIGHALYSLGAVACYRVYYVVLATMVVRYRVCGYRLHAICYKRCP